jgi:TolB-like protein
MKINGFCITVFLVGALFLVTTCNSAPTVQSASAGAGVAPVQAAPASPFYTGDGGKGTSIAILPLKDSGLTEDQNYLLTIVQSEFVSNFRGYSAIEVLDRVQINNVYRELEASGLYEDNVEAVMDYGHMMPTDYLMDGTITKTTTGYALQVQIVKTAAEDKMTAASYSKSCTFVELDNFTGIRRASLDLLQQMGVQLTARTRTELDGAARAQVVDAQTADAKGYTAERGGRTAEAAIYYTQAAAIDPSMLQTASRASTLTASIASGSIGAGTRDLIQQRKDWIDLLTETEETIYKLISSASENPPYTLYYSNDIKWGDINYQTESRDASFETNLRGRGYWFDSVRIAAQSVYGAVYDGLTRTGHKDEWGLGNWPGSGVTQQNPFSTSWRHDINVVFELVNDQGMAIGRQTYSRRPGYEPRRDGNQISVSYAVEDFVTVSFYGVKAADISDRGMSIRVASVNGAPPEQTPFQITMLPNWESNTFLLVENGVVKGFLPGVDAGRYRNLVIPSTVWADPVTAIEDNAFKEKQLTGVVISEGVVSIGNDAFANNQLTSVVIPSGVTTIRNDAFRNNQLTSVVISEGVVSIGNNAFRDNLLTSVIIPDGVVSIGAGAFSHNFGYVQGYPDGHFTLVSAVIPASVTYIGYDAINTAVDGYVIRFAGANISYRDDSKAIAICQTSYGDFPKYYMKNGMKAGRYTYKSLGFLAIGRWTYSRE